MAVAGWRRVRVLAVLIGWLAERRTEPTQTSVCAHAHEGGPRAFLHCVRRGEMGREYGLYLACGRIIGYMAAP